MKSLYVNKKLKYDGQQLHSLYAYLNHQLLGDSIISWVGPCQVSFDHMVDGEDLLAKSAIRGDEMLHFIVEIFDRDLFSAVGLQRLFASLARDYLQDSASSQLKNKILFRDGDDIYLGNKKLSISIATKTPVSTMIHFAMNVVNKGTPVETLALKEDLELKPQKVATDLMKLFCQEYESMLQATRKVKPVS